MKLFPLRHIFSFAILINRFNDGLRLVIYRLAEALGSVG
jgi:hypothetical protein